MAHDSRTGCSDRSAGGVGSGRSGLASGSGRSAGRLAFWARFALVVLLGLLAGLGVAWVSARRPEWRPVAVFALAGSAGLVLLVRRYWPQWLLRYTGFVLLGLGWLTARRWGVHLGWEVFLTSAMLYGLGLGVWDAVRERRGCGVGCFARSPDGCGPECGMRGRRYVSDAGAVGSVNYCAKCLAGEACGCDSQPSAGSEQVSTSPDNRNASVGCGHSCVVCSLHGGNARLEPTQPCDDRNASVVELAEAEHRLRVSRRRLELLRPLSEESNLITDEILRLYKLSDEEVLREVGLPRASLATIRELREKLETAEADCRVLDEARNCAETDAANALAELAHWRSGARRKTDLGTENGQRQVAGQVGEGSASDTRSWPTSATAPQPVQNSDENPSELDATAGPNVSGQLDLPFDALGGRPLVQHADPVAAYEQSRGTRREAVASTASV